MYFVRQYIVQHRIGDGIYNPNPIIIIDLFHPPILSHPAVAVAYLVGFGGKGKVNDTPVTRDFAIVPVDNVVGVL